MIKYTLLILALPYAALSDDIYIKKDTTLNTTWSIPASTVIHFQNNACIHGTGSLLGGIIDAPLTQQIFDTTLTVVPSAAYGKDFSCMWYGAKPANKDNWQAIQKSINASMQGGIKNCFLPRGVYHHSKSLVIQFLYKGMYAGAALHFYGEGEFWEERSVLILDNPNGWFCIGVQCGKGVEIDHLALVGQFAAPTTTGAEYYNTPITSYGTSIMTYGLVIDYDGTKNASGSTGCKFHDLIIRNFQVGISVSPNGVTYNADILYFRDIHFGDLRIGFQSGQAQEKGNEIHGLSSWGKIHTLIQIGQNAKFQAGNYTIDVLNVANACIRLFDIRQAGWYSTSISNVFAESIGSIGSLTTGDSKNLPPIAVSNSTFHFALPTTCGVQTLLVSNSPAVKFSSCTIRYYGGADTMNITGPATFLNCFFSGPVKVGPQLIAKPAQIVPVISR